MTSATMERLSTTLETRDGRPNNPFRQTVRCAARR